MDSWKGRVDAGRAAAGIADPGQFHRAKDRGDGTRAQATVGVSQLAVVALDEQGGPQVTVASLLEVSLEEQALEFPAFGLLLGFDPMQGKLEGITGSQPGLELGELESRQRGDGGCCQGGWFAGRERVRGWGWRRRSGGLGCRDHIPTV
jgi:hypothetical protein